MSTPDEIGIQHQPPLHLPPLADPPVVVLVPPPLVLPVAEKPALPPDRTIRENAFVTVVGWVLRFVVGVFMMCNVFPLSFITSIAVFGWLQRRMQAVILRGWWRESPRRLEGTFQQFCDSLGSDAPCERPRWFWRERIVQHLNRPRRTGAIANFFETLFFFLTLPVHSLWVNFKVGIQGLFATYMLTGWGCMIMLFSWYFGWLNSFHKGYEDAFLGLGMGLFGSVLLIAALLYVPMAQAHQAAAGEIAAFFQFRVVIRLILTRPTAYVLSIAGLALTSLIFELLRLRTASENFGPNQAASVQEAFWMLERYWLLCSIFFFFALLVLRTVSAMIYRSAMLKAIRNGTIRMEELPGNLVMWFTKLEILPEAQLPQPMLRTMLWSAVGFKYRVFLFGVACLLWLLFVMRFYGGLFFVFSEYRGMLNHPVVQVPCIDWTPWHLLQGREE